MRKIKICWHDVEDGTPHHAEIEIGDDDNARDVGYAWFRNRVETRSNLQTTDVTNIDIDSIFEVVDGKMIMHLLPFSSD